LFDLEVAVKPRSKSEAASTEGLPAAVDVTAGISIER
jgi:hypothetical protein